MSGSAKRIKGKRTTVPTLDNAKLCIKCLHCMKVTLDCEHPMMPINLVHGRRIFPCVIARGYDQLCGSAGRYWEERGPTNDTAG